MRDELLNETLFTSLTHAREKVAALTHDYQTGRPRSSLDYAALASPASLGNDAEALFATG